MAVSECSQVSLAQRTDSHHATNGLPTPLGTTILDTRRLDAIGGPTTLGRIATTTNGSRGASTNATYVKGSLKWVFHFYSNGPLFFFAHAPQLGGAGDDPMKRNARIKKSSNASKKIQIVILFY